MEHMSFIIIASKELQAQTLTKCWHDHLKDLYVQGISLLKIKLNFPFMMIVTLRGSPSKSHSTYFSEAIYSEIMTDNRSVFINVNRYLENFIQSQQPLNS